MRKTINKMGKSNQILINKYILFSLILSSLFLVWVTFNLTNKSYEVQSYAGQKGAPEKPPKGVYNIVTGVVYNMSGEPIGGAKITTAQKTVQRNIMADQFGKYTIEFPYCVNCKSVITYSANGYQSQSIDTYQIPGGTLIQDVVLQKL